MEKKIIKISAFLFAVTILWTACVSKKAAESSTSVTSTEAKHNESKLSTDTSHVVPAVEKVKGPNKMMR
jgi:hypothetical protein